MSEQLTLTTPIPQTLVKIDRVYVNATAQTVHVFWSGDAGQSGTAFYPTPAPDGSTQPSGSTLLHSLNTGNFTTTSLVKQIIQRLQTDGYLPAGTITGTPS